MTIKKQMPKKPRTYTGVLQFFHNFEHSPAGTNHCHSAGKYPYTIKHSGGRHVISNPVARGHGKGNKEQWWKFPKKMNGGYDMGSGIRIVKPKDIG